MSGGTARPPIMLRREGDALPGAAIGVAPIVWNNVDFSELRLGTDAPTIIDEIARTGYEGCQLGLGFPEGRVLRAALAERSLRLAEVYASIPTTEDGPRNDALFAARERLRLLHDGEGEVLCVALDLAAGREEHAGRAGEVGTPVLTETGWEHLVSVLHEIAQAARDLGHPTVFHPHAGTFVEAPAEIERLVAISDPALLGICLDVGHLLVGGGDPVSTVRGLGARLAHVHLKDVDPRVLARLRAGSIDGFGAAIRERLFTELGAGVLDLDGVIRALAERHYAGWLMVEQDSAWGPPSESAAIGRRVLAESLRRVGREVAA